MEFVILGLKNKKDGSIKVFDVERRTNNHVTVNDGDVLTIKTLSPFPFEHFSSLTYDHEVFISHSPIYLLVKAHLSSDELNQMSHGSVASHRFRNKKIEVLSEFHTPFEYGLNQLNEYGDRLGTYDLTTWIIHEETKSEQEFRSMSKILKIAALDKKSKDYPLDMSLDKYVLPYIKVLMLVDGRNREVTFGHYGTISITKEDMLTAELSKDEILFLIKKVPSLAMVIHHPKFNIDFYKKNIEDTELESHVISVLYEDVLKEFKSIGFDMDYLFSRYYSSFIKGYPNYSDAETILELVSDSNYKTITAHYDPHEYYCCEDCDGYIFDSDEESYDYQIDEQVSYLRNVLNEWEVYLSDNSLPLFSTWVPDIFNRYLKENPESPFGKKLFNTYTS